MFTKLQVSQSVIDSVSKILKEDDCVTPVQSKKIADKEVEKHEKHMHKGKKPTFEAKSMEEDKLKETGFHMAAHAAKKAGQPHFTFQGKKYPTTAKSTAECMEETSVDEASTFDWKANKSEKDPLFTTKKPGERTGHDSKKTSTGTVYTKRPVKSDDKEMKEEKSFDELLEDLNDSQVDKLIYEVLSKDATAGDYIHDFVHSKNPKFAGKSKEMRKKMALGAYYKKQNEEVEIDEGMMDTVKKVGGKVLKTLGHGSDDDMRKDLQKKAGLPQTGEKPKKEAVEPSSVTTDTLAGPVKGGKPNQHSSIKVKLKAESHTPMSHAKDLAKKAMKKVKSEMLGKTGTSE